MSNDLISREALKKFAIPCEIKNGALTDLCVPVYQIDNAPTVVVGYLTNCANCERVEKIRAKRPQGEWGEPFEHGNKTYHKCSCCHISSELILIDNFCPNCGADMRKGGAE